MRFTVLGLLVAIAISSCSSTPQGPLPPAPAPITLDELTELTQSGSPTVVNVWASWCLPCRSEAPLLATGSTVYPDVTFIGLNVKDTPEGAQSFMAEYLADADMDHYADDSGRIPIDLGAGPGVPATFFFDADGNLVAVHRGIIDEPTLARFLDEIDR